MKDRFPKKGRFFFAEYTIHQQCFMRSLVHVTRALHQPTRFKMKRSMAGSLLSFLSLSFLSILTGHDRVKRDIQSGKSVADQHSSLVSASRSLSFLESVCCSFLVSNLQFAKYFLRRSPPCVSVDELSVWGIDRFSSACVCSGSPAPGDAPPQ